MRQWFSGLNVIVIFYNVRNQNVQILCNLSLVTQIILTKILSTNASVIW